MHQEHGRGLDPAPIRSQPDGGNEVVNVRMGAQVPRPGLQHTYHADLATQKAWIVGQLLERRGGTAEEERRDAPLVLAG